MGFHQLFDRVRVNWVSLPAPSPPFRSIAIGPLHFAHRTLTAQRGGACERERERERERAAFCAKSALQKGWLLVACLPARPPAPACVACLSQLAACRRWSSATAPVGRDGWMEGSLMSHWANLLLPASVPSLPSPPFRLQSPEESGKEGKPAGIRIRAFQRQL